MATNNEGESLNRFLKDQNLEKYFEKFKEQGAYHVEDVLDGVDKDVLINDIGMTPLEANKFLKMIDKYKADEGGAEDIQEKSNLQYKRAQLTIRYHLFTTLQPSVREVCSLNTDELHYYDLVNIICDSEQDQLGENLTVELYTCEGYPLATYPSAYIRKLSDWCLESYPDTPLLYAIPRPKIYTHKQTKHTARYLTKGNDVIYIGSINCFVKADCSKSTYYELINNIQDITGIPAHLIQLKYNGQLILEPATRDTPLNELKIPIKDGVVIEFVTSADFWNPLWCNNFSCLQYQPTWYEEQSK